MRRKDKIPTPSHPTKNWNMLFDVTRSSIAIRNANRYLKKRSMFGSASMYQVAKSKMAHVTKRAIGKKKSEYGSKTKLDSIGRVWLSV